MQIYYTHHGQLQLLDCPKFIIKGFKRENTLFLKAQFVIKITTMRPVFLGSVSRVKLYF